VQICLYLFSKQVALHARLILDKQIDTAASRKAAAADNSNNAVRDTLDKQIHDTQRN